MGTKVTFTKKLAASSSSNICTSQSLTGGTPALLNGATSNYLSTTTTAAVAAGGTVIPLTSVTGLVVGQPITDTTAVAIVAGSTITAVGTSSVSIWPPVGGVGVGSGDTIVCAGTATIDAATASNSALGTRVVVAYSGTDTSFVITGTGPTGNVITDTIVGASGAGQSNLDFVTVTSIVSVGSVTAFTAGTNGVGSTQWYSWNWRGYSPMNLGFAVELVSGSVNFTVQHTYDDPNNLPAGVTYPLSVNNPDVQGAIATVDGAYTTPIVATRLLINSGTGEIRCRFEQAGAG